MMTKTPRGLCPAAFVPPRLGQGPRVAVPVDTQRGRKGESWRASTLCWGSSGSWKARTSPCTRSGARWCATATPTACAALSPARRAASPTTARCSPCRPRSASAAAPAPRCAPPAPLEAHHPSDAALAAAARASRAANEGAAYLGCGELLERARGRYDEEKIARVECLGRVDEALLADLAVEGAREVVLIHGDCERCEHKRGRACAEAVVETAEKLLEIWGSPMTVRFSGKLPASAKKMADSRQRPPRRARGKRRVGRSCRGSRSGNGGGRGAGRRRQRGC